MKVTQKYKVLGKIETGKCETCGAETSIEKNKVVKLPWTGYWPSFHPSEALSIYPHPQRDKNGKLKNFFYVQDLRKLEKRGNHFHQALIWNDHIQSNPNIFTALSRKVEIR